MLPPQDRNHDTVPTRDPQPLRRTLPPFALASRQSQTSTAQRRLSYSKQRVRAAVRALSELSIRPSIPPPVFPLAAVHVPIGTSSGSQYAWMEAVGQPLSWLRACAHLPNQTTDVGA
jgi:hypothetical protein